MAHISPETMASVAARDARTDWEAGDIVFCVSEAILTYYTGTEWMVIATTADLA